MQVSQLPSRELVPGDVVELHAGDRVPADLRIAAMKTATLRAEQSSLTGESMAVNKGAAPGAEEGCELQACQLKLSRLRTGKPVAIQGRTGPVCGPCGGPRHKPRR